MPSAPDDRRAATPAETRELAERIGHRFADSELLARALTHRSYCAEHDGVPSNERLEFLGDAVLGWVVADLAFHRFERLPEGDLTDLRKSVVNGGALADVARQLALGSHLRLGRGEERAGGAGKESILSDALEAVIGAVYLDGGADAAYAMVDRHIGPRLDASVGGNAHVDHKTVLQELCARIGQAPPEYRLASSGPDHEKVFRADALVGGRVAGTGAGRSKKAAEQDAARHAVDSFEWSSSAPTSG